MKIIFTLIIILFFQEVYSQPVEEWVQRYNGTANSYDIVSKMIVDKNNNIYVMGSSNGLGSYLDFLIIKYSSDGNVIWIERYNGVDNSIDQINSACLDNSGNCYVTGFTTDSSFQPNLTTAKFDSSGNLQWVKVFRKEGYSTGIGQDIAYDNFGNLIVCGFIKNLKGYFDIETIKYSSSGNELWSKTFNGEGNKDDVPVTLKIDNSDNILIAGTTKSTDNNDDMIIIKYNSLSTLIWEKTFNGTSNLDDRITSMILDKENNIYFCGSMYNSSSSFDYFYVKLDVNGNIQWTGNYNGAGNSLDIPSAIQLDQGENIYITGYARNGSISGSEDIVTLKINPAGGILWTKIYDGKAIGTDQSTSIEIDEYENVYIGGASDRENFHLVYALLKYDPSGNLQWVENYFNSNTPEDFIYNVALDDLNNVYVTGISFDSTSDFDFATIKYSQLVNVNQNTGSIINDYVLYQNYPNPFNPVTVIKYVLPQDARREMQDVKLIVYDLSGKEAVTLVNGNEPAGSYSVEFDGSNLPSGVYFYKLTINSFTDSKKMFLIK